MKQCVEARRLYAFRLMMPKDSLAYVEDTLSYYKWTTILCDGIRAAGQARREGRPMGELLHATVQALRQRYFEFPAWNEVLMSDALREAGLSVNPVPLAAWVALHLSLGPVRRQGQGRGNRLAQALKREREWTGERVHTIIDKRIATAVHLAYAGQQWQALGDLYHQASNALYSDIVRGLGRPLECPALFAPAPQEDASDTRLVADDLDRLISRSNLSGREHQVAMMFGQGMPLTEIAKALGLKTQRVNPYLTRSIQKMQRQI